jgi:hypothetical protein
VDADGVTRIEQPRAGVGLWLVGLAGAFTLGSFVLSAWLLATPDPEEVEPPLPTVRGPTLGAPPVHSLPGFPLRAQPGEQPMDAPLTPEEEFVGRELVPSEVPVGEKSGLALFVPGTKPIKRGIVVPEGFELPPGYVRHYQTTDNGQMLEPILTFHPDHQPLDANGQPLQVPENRVVPVEMAPPGMPIVMLEVPEGPESGR